jgi:hypothetical protein
MVSWVLVRGDFIVVVIVEIVGDGERKRKRLRRGEKKKEKTRISAHRDSRTARGSGRKDKSKVKTRKGGTTATCRKPRGRDRARIDGWIQSSSRRKRESEKRQSVESVGRRLRRRE